jgi:integrase
MAKRKRSSTIEESGVRVRIFRRGSTYWLDVRLDGRPRVRKSAETTDKETAEASGRALALEIARQTLLGLKPDTLTLGQLFTAYAQHKGQALEGQWKRSAETRQRLFLAAWGSDLPVASISQSSVDAFSGARRRAWLAKQEGTEAPRALRDGALDCDFRWLSSVFNWAIKHKLNDGARLLAYNPLHDCQWPRERNVRRPIASHERYTLTSAQAGKVDPMGRLRAILALARFTARRESAIIQLRADDVLLSRGRIAAALAAEGMDERRAEKMPHGALRWRSAADKQGVTHIAPISKEARTELELYLSTSPRVGNVPLFPASESPDRCISRYTASKWLTRAETLAGLPKLVGGTFHPYRRLWATERKDRSMKTVAAAGGWKSTKSLAIYQGVDDTDILDAVVNG